LSPANKKTNAKEKKPEDVEDEDGQLNHPQRLTKLKFSSFEHICRWENFLRRCARGKKEGKQEKRKESFGEL